MTRGWSAKEIIEDELFLHDRETVSGTGNRTRQLRAEHMIDRLKQAGHLATDEERERRTHPDRGVVDR